MWFKEPARLGDWSQAIAHLRAVDPILRQIIDRVGPCKLRPRRDHFCALCEAIISQQVATKVAEVFFERFRGLFPRRRPIAGRVAVLTDESLRQVGLSRSKVAYLRDLSRCWMEGVIPAGRFGRMDDAAVMESLVAVKGIGRWTAEMFLIFCLNRPDVLPVDDLGIRKAVGHFYKLPGLPDEMKLGRMGRKWQPWRTVATWYLWRGSASE
jgi:DNA-3-methyladenine glycosylase II